MKAIFRELLRQKKSTILNVIGLSCAFATFIIISMQVRYDVTFDSNNKNYNSIFLLNMQDSVEGYKQLTFNRQRIYEFKEQVPQIEYITVHNYAGGQVSLLNSDNEKGANIIQRVLNCYAEITDIFTFDFVEGDESALQDPNNVIISDVFAETWYNGKFAVGEKMLLNDVMYTIGAVYKDFPQNSTLANEHIIKNVGDEDIDDTTNWNYRAFVKIKDNSNKHELDASIEQAGDKLSFANSRSNAVSLDEFRTFRGYDKNNTYIMIIIALAIVLLAAINFVNFATSMVPLKIKGLNLRKVVGATNAELRVGVVCESVVLVVFSFLISLALVELFKESSLSAVIADVSWALNWGVYLIAFAMVLLTGVVSGLYPAFYSTSFHPALVLKSSYAMSASGVRFRKILIGFQFFVAISFISITIFVQMQHDHLINRDGGYLREGVIHIHHGSDYAGHGKLKNELLKNPQIQDVTFSAYAFGTGIAPMSWHRTNSKGPVFLLSFPVAYNFLDFFDIEILEGRNFIESDEVSENGYLIVNKAAMHKYGFPEGEKITGHKAGTDIIGVCEDVNLENMKSAVVPYTFYIFGKDPWYLLSHSYIKVTEESPQVIEYIRNVYKQTDPNVVVTVQYLNDEMENSYTSENVLRQIMQVFSFLAIIIALGGVFGMVSFDTRFKRKEIGLRRINGATVNDILTMFGAAYVKIIAVSFVVSVPVVYFFISQWLESFPYQIEVYWWVFVLSLVMVLLLTIAISIVQTIRVARENPVDAVK